jgi:hypothetical protein
MLLKRRRSGAGTADGTAKPLPEPDRRSEGWAEAWWVWFGPKSMKYIHTIMILDRLVPMEGFFAYPPKKNAPTMDGPVPSPFPREPDESKP